MTGFLEEQSGLLTQSGRILSLLVAYSCYFKPPPITSFLKTNISVEGT